MIILLLLHPLSSLNVTSIIPEDIWILDYGATDHMIRVPYISHPTPPCLESNMLLLLMDLMLLLLDTTIVQLQPSHVLHVSKLSNNLFSMHKLK